MNWSAPRASNAETANGLAILTTFSYLGVILYARASVFSVLVGGPESWVDALFVCGRIPKNIGAMND